MDKINDRQLTINGMEYLWTIDQTLVYLESIIGSVSGIIIKRALMDVAIMLKEGIEPTSEDADKGYGLVWALCLGTMYCPEKTFYAYTIKECCLKAAKELV